MPMNLRWHKLAHRWHQHGTTVQLWASDAGCINKNTRQTEAISIPKKRALAARSHQDGRMETSLQSPTEQLKCGRLSKIGAGGVRVCTAPTHGARAGSSPSSALQAPAFFKPRDLAVRPISHRVARDLCVKHHYLNSYPGGSLFNFGVFAGHALLGVAVVGVGPFNIHRLFRDAEPGEVVCLSRLWIDDRCGRNSESRVLGIILRQLRRHQSGVKAVVSYSDPAAGHTGMVYRAAGFLYLGRSEAMPKYRLSDGSVHHSRSLGHRLGTHSLVHLRAHGLEVHTVPQAPKFIYVALIDASWRDRLTRRVLPYSEVEASHASD